METKLIVSINKQEKKKIQDIAGKQGLGISPFVRMILLNKISEQENLD